MDYASTSPRELASAIIAAGASRTGYRPVRRGGATKSAAHLAGILSNGR